MTGIFTTFDHNLKNSKKCHLWKNMVACALNISGIAKENGRTRMATVDLLTISRRQEQVPQFADGLAYY